tara:strand:- start:2175 stop:2711 length:537 start_codon:yes stop_codon:yes gene_type:complete
MARDLITTVYTFDELDQGAQDRAHSKWLQTGLAWSWWEEWQASIEAFCAIAPIDLIRSDIAAAHVDVTWSDDHAADLSGVRAWVWLHNNGWADLAKANAAGSCTLTGFCGDCPAFDPIAAYCQGDPRKVPDLEQVFYEAAQAWAQGARQDQEASDTAKAFADVCEANEYEFTSMGTLV